MQIDRILAQLTVSDLTAAEAWYRRLFGSAPDARPMDGLLEWHLSPAFGVQVFAEAARAGHSSVVLDVDDVDPVAVELTAAGIEHSGPLDATTTRILPLTDADGNRIVVTSRLRAG